MPTIYQIILIALLTTFVILFLHKIGAIEYLRNKACKEELELIAKLLECDFCMCFWTSLVISCVASLITHDNSWIVIPVLSTPISRFLL